MIKCIGDGKALTNVLWTVGWDRSVPLRSVQLFQIYPPHPDCIRLNNYEHMPDNFFVDCAAHNHPHDVPVGTFTPSNKLFSLSHSLRLCLLDSNKTYHHLPCGSVHAIRCASYLSMLYAKLAVGSKSGGVSANSHWKPPLSPLRPPQRLTQHVVNVCCAGVIVWRCVRV